MVKVISVTGHESFINVLEEHAGNPDVYVAFYANPDDGGISWCPDCRVADPILRGNFDKLPEDGIFIFCYAGERAEWKDQNNAFRQDSKFKIKCLPTLIKIGTDKRLEEGECAQENLVQNFFTASQTE